MLTRPRAILLRGLVVGNFVFEVRVEFSRFIAIAMGRNHD